MRSHAGSDRNWCRRWRVCRAPAARFVLLLSALLALVASCTPQPARLPPTPTPTAGTLDVDIDYTATWYRETFGYTRRAENIRHFVLVLPAAEHTAGRASAGEIFVSLRFPTRADELAMQDNQPNAWALPYLHAAPEGHFRGDFEPGTYFVAVAFIAAPLTRAEAGVADDVILYPGITGGGASTDYRKVEIQPGENSIRFELTDKNGWACPWLYALGRHGFERRTEILRNVRGEANAATETTSIGPVEIIDGAITVAVAEERDEVTFLDQLVIIADGTRVALDPATDNATRVAERDGARLVIRAGQTWTFRFPLPSAFAGRERATVSVIAAGFYVPAPF